ncbi:unnamed protein product [Larinioides sclopetarius]|uniref:Uncharacterized protein n=1 Tax=Larinioides sclopetarius TaxID=280406 RepID=A0AAV1YZV4_9ARAC
MSTFQQSLDKKNWNFQAGYFHFRMQIDDTPVMSSVNPVSFPDGWLI